MLVQPSQLDETDINDFVDAAQSPIGQVEKRAIKQEPDAEDIPAEIEVTEPQKPVELEKDDSLTEPKVEQPSVTQPDRSPEKAKASPKRFGIIQNLLDSQRRPRHRVDTRTWPSRSCW